MSPAVRAPFPKSAARMVGPRLERSYLKNQLGESLPASRRINLARPLPVKGPRVKVDSAGTRWVPSPQDRARSARTSQRRKRPANMKRSLRGQMTAHGAVLTDIENPLRVRQEFPEVERER